MNILITGGVGFIGSHLAERLLERGNRVCIVDDLSTGSLKNIQHLQENPNFSLVLGSILDESLMERLVDESEEIYHLAAAVGVKYIMEHPLRSIHVNVHGTEIVLKLASKSKKKVMVASSSEVYGKDGNFPYKEDGTRLMGATSILRWSYACTKALDEFLALAYWREKKLPVVIMRFFNTCGPKQTGQYGMVIPRFVSNALSGKPLVVYGDGNQSRCFTYVGDVIRGIIALMACPKAVGEVFNIGSTQEIQIKELAQKVIQLTGNNSKIEYMSYEDAYGKGFEDMKRRVPDISKIYKFIGWQPSVEIDELLGKVIEYYRTEGKRENVTEREGKKT
ncbi:GDP-mannose 4,6-dehydratase [bacterium]|nr:GDP-mannose 4,6-dehydratase [bacterium]